MFQILPVTFAPTPTPTHTPTQTTPNVLCNCNCITFVNTYDSTQTISYFDCSGQFIQTDIQFGQQIKVCGGNPEASGQVTIEIGKPCVEVDKICECPPDIICGSGVTTGGKYLIYTDCCNNVIEGYDAEPDVLVTLNYNYPSINITKLNIEATVFCPTPTPTPTPSFTPTSTTTPTLTRTPTQTPTNSQVVRFKNECDVFTLFDMGIKCNTIVQPTTSDSLDGILSVIVTGGTSPYSYYWAGGQRSQTLIGVSQGSYEVVVIDYYGDYSATTICSLFGPTATMTPSPTTTPTMTPSGTQPQLCFIAIGGQISYGPWQFIANGSTNGRTRWFSNEGYYITWSESRNRWEVLGTDNTTPFEPSGGGLFASTTTSLYPDAGWSVIGGNQAYSTTVNQGLCPPSIPIQVTLTSENNSCNTTINCNGSITVNATNGTAPYTYSINNGVTYQTSSIFNNLCSGTYTIITTDATGSINSQTISVGYDTQGVTYQLTIIENVDLTQIVTTNNYQSKTTHLQVVVTPPLPVGLVVNFNLTLSSIKTYNGPGTGIITDNIRITEAGIIKTPITTTSITIDGDRPNCNPESQVITTETKTYSLSMSSVSDILIRDISTLEITNGVAGAQSNCLTNLIGDVYAQFITPEIIGCNCCAVVGDTRLVSINNNSLTYVPGTVSPTTPVGGIGEIVCIGFNNGNVTFNSFTGGSGLYQMSEFSYIDCISALNANSWINVSYSKTYAGLTNGTSYFGLRDANNISNIACLAAQVNCNTGGGGCPTPDMKIMTENGFITAGDLTTNDLIYTQHETTNEWGNYEVSDVRMESQPILKLNIGGEIITVSDSHKLLTEFGEYKTISDIQIGDNIQTVNGLYELISIDKMGIGTVVRIEVKDAHTYVVNNIISHNKPAPPPTP